MRVFKHLIALADIAVGFLGLFFIIFAITQPGQHETSAQTNEREKAFHQLQERIHELEKLQLAGTRAGRPLPGAETASVTLTENEIRIRVRQQESAFSDSRTFQNAASKLDWPSEIVLYVDQRIPFARVVEIIDALKQIQGEITVRIAALAHPN